MKTKNKRLVILVALSIGSILLPLLIIHSLSNVTHAQGPDGYSIYYVAPAGNCGGMTPCFGNAQDAIDMVDDPDDVVKVAAGAYIGVTVREGITQAVYISKTVTVRGGYTTTNWIMPYAITQPTILDAQGQGRVFYITGHISPTIEGIHITGGDADGLGGNWGGDAGGGIYITDYAAPTIYSNTIYANAAARGGGVCVTGYSNGILSENVIYENNALDDGGGLLISDAFPLIERNTIRDHTIGDNGGGVYIEGYSTPVLRENLIIGNNAGTWEWGGGIYVDSWTGPLILASNTISNNTAGWGGGVYVDSYAYPTLTDNEISNNVVNQSGLQSSDGGGVYVHEAASPFLYRNYIHHNFACDKGGGIFLWASYSFVEENTITQNTASSDGAGVSMWASQDQLINNLISDNNGSGVHIWYYAQPILNSNVISNNSGSGVHILDGAQPTLNGNRILANTAERGGGARIEQESYPTFNNNFIYGNSADMGSGLYIQDAYATLLNNTIARNTEGDGSGIFVANDSWVAVTNTILVSHTVGVTVTSGNIVTLEATLWGAGAWANKIDWGGPGAVVTGTRNYWGDPAFVDPDAGDYHVHLSSVAIDKGVKTSVTDDIDGDPRPQGNAYDLGADETGLVVVKEATLDVGHLSASLTYTIRITNTSNVAVTAAITDILPAQVTPGGVRTWTTSITAPGGVWTKQFTVTVNMGYTGVLTNVVQVSTEEGATGTYTHTVIVEEPISGLSAVNDSPTELGNATTLMATVTTGSNVTYTWAFGDGGTGSGAAVTHVYPLTGVHTAVVTASNSVGVLTATTTVTITIEPYLDIYLPVIQKEN